MTPEIDRSAELAEARRRLAELESLVEISPVAIVVMDADERVTGWNPAAAQLFGYSPQEAIGRLIDDLVLDEDLRGEGRDVTHEALERDRADRITQRVRKDGETVDVQMMLVPLRVDGEHVGFYAIYHDITELQRAREHAETLLAVTQVLGKTLSLEDTFEAILDELQRVVPYDSCSIQVIQGNRLVIVGARGFDDLGGPARSGLRPGRRLRPRNPGRAVEAATGLRRRVARARIRERAARRRTHPRMDLRPDDRRRPRRSASLSVDKFEPDFYNEALAELATAFAAQAAMAIEKARLLETERAAREQAETLRAAAESLGSTLGMSEVFDLILRSCARSCPIEPPASSSSTATSSMIVGGHGFPDLDELLGHRFDWRGPDDPALGAGPAARAGHRLGRLDERYQHFEDAHGEGQLKAMDGRPVADRRSPDRHAHARLVRARLLHRRAREDGRGIRRVRRDGDRQGPVRQRAPAWRARRRRRRHRRRAPSSRP